MTHVNAYKEELVRAERDLDKAQSRVNELKDYIESVEPTPKKSSKAPEVEPSEPTPEEDATKVEVKTSKKKGK